MPNFYRIDGVKSFAPDYARGRCKICGLIIYENAAAPNSFRQPRFNNASRNFRTPLISSSSRNSTAQIFRSEEKSFGFFPQI